MVTSTACGVLLKHVTVHCDSELEHVSCDRLVDCIVLAKYSRSMW